jgi:hypothetical protein
MTRTNDTPRRRLLDIFRTLRTKSKARRALEDDVLESARLRAIGL